MPAILSIRNEHYWSDRTLKATRASIVRDTRRAANATVSAYTALVACFRELDPFLLSAAIRCLAPEDGARRIRLLDRAAMSHDDPSRRRHWASACEKAVHLAAGLGNDDCIAAMATTWRPVVTASAFGKAAAAGNVRTLRVMKGMGLIVHQVSWDECRTVLESATLGGMAAVEWALAEYLTEASPDAQQFALRECLKSAARTGDVRMFDRMWLDAGWLPDSERCRCLEAAADSGNFDMFLRIRAVCPRQPPTDSLNREWQLALASAARHGHAYFASRLIEHDRIPLDEGLRRDIHFEALGGGHIDLALAYPTDQRGDWGPEIWWKVACAICGAAARGDLRSIRMGLRYWDINTAAAMQRVRVDKWPLTAVRIVYATWPALLRQVSFGSDGFSDALIRWIHFELNRTGGCAP